MENKIECFLANLDGYVYLVPTSLREEFEGTSYYDRKPKFSEYMLTDDAVFDSIFVDDCDLQALIDGDLC